MTIVSPAHGWQWIATAFALFRKNPLIWIILHLLMMLIGFALGMLPVIGPSLFYLLTPLFLGGLMCAAKDLESGKKIEIAHLFRGFHHNTSNLIAVGGVYMIGELVISGLMKYLGGAELAAVMEAGIEGIDPASVTPEVASRMLMVMMVGLTLFVPLIMATWFSPTRVMLDNQQPFAAMGESVRACLRNMPAFLIYGAWSVLLLIAALMPFGIGLALWIPVMVLSTYTSYRDVFAAAAATPAET